MIRTRVVNKTWVDLQRFLLNQMEGIEIEMKWKHEVKLKLHECVEKQR